MGGDDLLNLGVLQEKKLEKLKPLIAGLDFKDDALEFSSPIPDVWVPAAEIVCAGGVTATAD